MNRRTPLSRGTSELKRSPLRQVSEKRQQESRGARASRPKSPEASGPKKASRRPETGFPAAVRLLIRTRAGNGDPAEARCEACARWLGLHGGQVQHIQARQMGGSRRRNTASNGALLCGTPQTLCHGRCERRDPHMRAMGFWLLQSDEPGPVMLHGEDGGVTVWLDDAGSYLFEPPMGRAA